MAPPEPEREPTAVREGVLDLLRVDVQLLRELGRELVAGLRADLVERGVELGGRDAERRRELPADLVTRVATLAPRAGLRAQALQRRADLRGIDAGCRCDVVHDRVEAGAEAAAAAVAVAVAEVLACLVQAGLHLRGVDAERLGQVGGQVAAHRTPAGLVAQHRAQGGRDLIGRLAERGRERLRELGAPLLGGLAVADRLERGAQRRLADAELRGQVAEAGAGTAAEAGTAASTDGHVRRGATAAPAAGSRGVRARRERAPVA